MRDTMYPVPADQLLSMIIGSLKKGQALGIYKSLFFNPNENDTFKSSIFGQSIATPIGLAAGPHTQMAQNIIAGWLCGARYIELKTVQTLDEIEVSKPCIDIGDEGYNCEWSQELKIRQSFEEYLKAWIIIHILHKELGHQGKLQTVFNMSVGYDMKGILNQNVQWFFEKMSNCSKEKKAIVDLIRPVYPAIDDLSIPDRISDNITLSTMHGCPADEIGTIGNYLLKEKKLHTFIKLNPTLLGQSDINKILRSMGYETRVPDIAFEHDIKFEAACELVNNLSATAQKENRDFGIKLTNTLESINNKDVFSEESMYMSGKALHPISINVAAKLRKVFPDLSISFCGGVNYDNIKDVLTSGLYPITICSDILTPGGYTKLLQYLDNLTASRYNEDHNPYLFDYAEKVKNDSSYAHTPKSIKTDRPLKAYDCIFAPCTETCPTHQNIPAYLAFAHEDKRFLALKTILETNPFPLCTGMICDHSCQSKCTRINMDNALRIRDIKRFISENTGSLNVLNKPDVKKKIAIIGAGPSGLSCAYYLALAGCDVEVYESKPYPGGMLADAIPEFRLSKDALNWDIDNIMKAGVKLRLSEKITKNSFRELREHADFIYIAAGAQKAIQANIPGSENTSGVWDPLEFLAAVRRGENVELGRKVIILGGGNTAMDVSRTVKRIGGKDCDVSIVYRRTRHEMPADHDEIEAALEEGIKLIELASPAKVLGNGNKINALKCHRMRLEKDERGGRPKPIEIPGEDFTIDAETIIPAFGQKLDVDFIDPVLLKKGNGMETKVENIFIGGDAYRGASFLIKAVADGKDVAKEIMSRIDAGLDLHEQIDRATTTREEHHKKLSRMIPGKKPKRVNVDKRSLNVLVDVPMTENEVRDEAARCLNCDEICDICVTVCPNRANLGYEIDPVDIAMEKIEFNKNGYELISDGRFKIEQRFQIMNIADLCNECGNCTTFCPTSGRPFADKPNIALSEESFISLESGYMKTDDEMLYKKDNKIYRMKHSERGYRFYSDDFKVELDPELRVLSAEQNGMQKKEISLYPAMNMLIMEKAIDQI